MMRILRNPSTSSSSNSSSGSSQSSCNVTTPKYTTPVSHNYTNTNNDNNTTIKSPRISRSTRNAMTACISNLALHDNGNDNGDKRMSIRGFASAIEVKLFSDARSYEEYIDPSTIVNRVNKILTSCLDDIGSDKISHPNPYADSYVDTGLSPTFLMSPPSQESNGKEIKQNIEDDSNSNLNLLSSAGCSRNFIIAVLEKVHEYANNIGFRTIKDIANDVIMLWLVDAKRECEKDKNIYGGTVFNANDKGTFWCDSKQFKCWWKNNIERSAKRKTYIDESVYDGADATKKAKAEFCLKVLSLSNEITLKKKNVKLSSKKINTANKKAALKIPTETINNKPKIAEASDELTNLLNVAIMAYNDENEKTKTIKNNTKTNDYDKVYNTTTTTTATTTTTKRKAIDVDNKTKTKRSPIITEEQEEFLSSLSSLSSPSSSSTFSTPSSLSKFVW